MKHSAVSLYGGRGYSNEGDELRSISLTIKMIDFVIDTHLYIWYLKIYAEFA